jgi:hypothetical protein
MKFDNLRLLDMDADGDLDILTIVEGEGIFTRGKGVVWLKNPIREAELTAVVDPLTDAI